MSQIPSHVQPEIKDALSRARAAGAQGPLSYVGAGMYGIVFCDEQGHAWKVFRRAADHAAGHERFLKEAVETEYEWLVSAAGSSVADHVARAFSRDLDHLVLERECVPGEPGGWKDESKLLDLHKEIARALEPQGWSAPEFKADSYILTPEGRPVLVDASMAMRIGRRLLEFATDVLDGKRFSYETPSTLVFFILRELGMGTVSKAEAAPVISRLVGMDPQIAETFSLSGVGASGAPSRALKGVWVKGRRYSIDISKNKATADVRDVKGRPFTSLNLNDMEDLLSLASYIRAGRPWEKSGRFVGDTGKDGPVVVDTKHGVRMKAMSQEDVAELVLISEEAVLAMV